LLEVVECTYKYLVKICVNYQNDNIVRDTTKKEIDALIGLLYLAGYSRSTICGELMVFLIS